MNFLKNFKITACATYVSGTAVVEGATLDMLGYDGVIAIMTTAAIAGSAAGDMHFETSTASNFSGGTDLTGTKIAVADNDDDQIFAVEINKPLERYLRAVVTKDETNAAAESVLYIQYKGLKRPVINNVTDLVTAELHVSPARGTK